MSQTLFAPSGVRVGFSRRANPDYGIVIVSNNSGIQEQASILCESFEGAAIRPVLNLSKYRGTPDAPTIIVNGDILGGVAWNGYTGALNNCANINVYVDGVPVANQVSASRMVFQTALLNNPAADNMALFSNGFLVIGSSKVARGVAEARGLLDVAGNATVEAYLERASTDAVSPILFFRKSRGTLAAPATVANGDTAVKIRASAYTNAWHDDLGGVQVYVSAAVVAGQAPATITQIFANANNAAAIAPLAVAVGTLAEGSIFMGAGYDTASLLHASCSRAGGGAAWIENTNASATAHVIYLRGGSNTLTGSKFLEFVRPDFTTIGSVSQNAAGTVIYNITSDRRLKKDIADGLIGLDELLRIRVREFRYKSDPTNHLTHGFIAQELVDIYPDAVSVGGAAKDCNCDFTAKGKRPAGSHDPDCVQANPWGVDYGRITPLLVRSIQQLAARVANLEKA